MTSFSANFLADILSAKYIWLDMAPIELLYTITDNFIHEQGIGNNVY